jgi:energy-coupling factor transporter ATP-binding protein EcfA2
MCQGEPVKAVLVTGVSGSGKSTIARQLTAMGHEAISMDGDDLLCGWCDRHGHRVTRPAEPDADWLAAHDWRWVPERLDAILADARRRRVNTLFLCGCAANGLDLADRFDAHILLDIDQKTMADRMADPARGNDYGRVGDSLTIAIAGHTAFLAAWRRYGAVTVDATQPVTTVGHEVLLSTVSALYLRTPGSRG